MVRIFSFIFMKCDRFEILWQSVLAQQQLCRRRSCVGMKSVLWKPTPWNGIPFFIDACNHLLPLQCHLHLQRGQEGTKLDKGLNLYSEFQKLSVRLNCSMRALVSFVISSWTISRLSVPFIEHQWFVLYILFPHNIFDFWIILKFNHVRASGLKLPYARPG